MTHPNQMDMPVLAICHAGALSRWTLIGATRDSSRWSGEGGAPGGGQISSPGSAVLLVPGGGGTQRVHRQLCIIGMTRKSPKVRCSAHSEGSKSLPLVFS